MRGLKRYAPLLLKEWAVEALLCFCFFAISLSISAAMGVGRLRDPLADIPVAALSLTILTMGVRFVYHISWLTYLR